MNTVTVMEDENGELYIELPDDFLRETGWDQDTELVWIINEDGTLELRKRQDDSSNKA
jgi:hypothetical protein